MLILFNFVNGAKSGQKRDSRTTGKGIFYSGNEGYVKGRGVEESECEKHC
jgi:hypothetical protein